MTAGAGRQLDPSDHLGGEWPEQAIASLISFVGLPSKSGASALRSYLSTASAKGVSPKPAVNALERCAVDVVVTVDAGNDDLVPHRIAGMRVLSRSALEADRRLMAPNGDANPHLNEWQVSGHELGGVNDRDSSASCL